MTIASALVLDPEVCLLDEPLMSLDYPGRCLVTQLVYHGPVHQLFSDQELLDRLGLLPAKTWQLSQLLGLKPEVLSLK